MALIGLLSTSTNSPTRPIARQSSTCYVDSITCLKFGLIVGLSVLAFLLVISLVRRRLFRLPRSNNYQGSGSPHTAWTRVQNIEALTAMSAGMGLFECSECNFEQQSYGNAKKFFIWCLRFDSVTAG